MENTREFQFIMFALKFYQEAAIAYDEANKDDDTSPCVNVVCDEFSDVTIESVQRDVYDAQKFLISRVQK